MTPAEAQTLTSPGMSTEDIDLDIPHEEREDLQVVLWRDEYGMWVDELEATLSGGWDFMFKDDLIVCSSFLCPCMYFPQ